MFKTANGNRADFALVVEATAPGVRTPKPLTVNILSSNSAPRGWASVKVKTFSSFESLPQTYVDLFERGAGEWYDSSLPWFLNFAETALDQGDKIRIYGAEDETASETKARAILATRYKERVPGFLSPSVLSSLSNFYTITFGPLCDVSGNGSAGALKPLVKAIASDANRWDMVELRPLDPDSVAYSSLVSSFQSAGMVVQKFFCFGNWYLTTAGLSFEQYFKTLPSAMQNTIKRKTKKLEKTGRSRIEIINSKENLESTIAAYEQIYLSSWKRPEPYPNFVSGLIRACAERGWLRMGVIYMDDQPIASQVWIVNSGKASIYKLGQDQHFDEFSAGSVLTAKLMEHVLEVDKVQEVDFGSGDDPYKKNWLPQRRERWGILAMNPRSVAGLAAIIRNIGGRAAKNVWQAIRRKPSQRTAEKTAPPEE
jgi:Acetyltransferase (GNAT) domain